ncbi:MAG: hypothetical protein ACI8TP_001539 [Acidimicrobiales bacterium]|jgi:hypothetical protein
MTSEQELADALASQSGQTDVTPGNLVAVATRGQLRRRRQRMAAGGTTAAVLLFGGIGLASLQRGSGTIELDAAGGPETAELTNEGAANDPQSTSITAGSTNAAEPEVADEPGTDPGRETLIALDSDQAALVEVVVVNDDLCQWAEYGRPELPEGFSLVELYQMPDRTEVALVSCALGAYQPTDVRLFSVSTNDGVVLTPLAVESFGSNGIELTMSLSGHIEVDAQAGVLTVYTKFRGLGDCGVSLVNHWDADQADRFVLDSAHGEFECSDSIDLEGEIAEWPQLYPTVSEEADDSADGEEVVPDGAVVLDVSDSCRTMARRAGDVINGGEAMGCIEQAIQAEFGDMSQIWVDDAIDDGESTLVVWKGSAFDGEFGLGTPWGFEEIHVIDTAGWTDQVIRNLRWEDPDDVDWMYAYRMEFVDASTIRLMEGWHQGECYWVSHLDLAGNEVPVSANPYPMPATLKALAADLSLCQFSIDFEPEILATMFDAPDSLHYFDG